MPLAGPAVPTYLQLVVCASPIFNILDLKINGSRHLLAYCDFYSGSIELIIRSLHGATLKIFVVPGILNGTPAVITI